MTWLLVGVGGGLGAILRHGTNVVVQRWLANAAFPTGIFLINVLGSGIIGLLAGLIASQQIVMSTEARAFVVVGILGGFTTFSSFSLDTLTLIKAGSTTLLRSDVTFPVDVQQRILRGISDEADRLEHLVANLLDISRLDQERFFLHYERVDVGQLLARLVETAERKSPDEAAKGHTFVLHLPRKPAASVPGEAYAVLQAR